MTHKEIVDLSMSMHTGMAGGDPAAVFWPQVTHAESERLLGYPMAANMFFWTEHHGTHVDAYYHFNPRGQAIDEIDLRQFILRGTLVDLTRKRGGEPITDADLAAACAAQKVEVIRDGALLMHTRAESSWYETREKAFDMPFLVESAARWVHEHGLALIGADCIGFENARIDIRRPVHNYLLHRNVLLLEGLCHLDALHGKRFTLFCAPVKIRKGTGAQTRAFAVVE